MPNTESQVNLNPDIWVNQYGDELYRYALKRVRFPERAEELVQETYLAAWKAKESFSRNSTEKTWLIGIMKHKIVDYYRKKNIENPISNRFDSLEELDAFFDEKGMWKKAPSDWSQDPYKILENKEFWKVFSNCLGKLPDNHYQVYTLKEVDELDSKEICKKLELTSTNLWVILHRTRLKLKECLEKNWFENP